MSRATAITSKRKKRPEPFGPGYRAGRGVPRTLTKGRVLCHNHVRRCVGMSCGVFGFRWWTERQVPDGFVRCQCGWTKLPHYRIEGDDVAMEKFAAAYRCDTPQERFPDINWDAVIADADRKAKRRRARR